MTPQLYDYNGGYWGTLEALVQNWGRSTKFKRVYVCKGGTIRDDQLRGTFNTNNALGRSCKVKIPKYNFMAILAETAAGSFQAIGFWMEHKDYTSSSGKYSSDNRAPTDLMKNHAMSIDELENKTGINFFCNLNDALENAVEKSYSESAWTW
jgi:endonuclease G